MLFRHLLQVSQVMAAAFLLSCAATTQTGVAKQTIRGGYGSLRQASTARSFRHTVSAQQLQSHRLAQRQNCRLPRRALR